MDDNNYYNCINYKGDNMPASPVTKAIDVLPDNWKELEKVIIPDDNTAHFYKVWFSMNKLAQRFGMNKRLDAYAWLMCCYIDEDVTDEERWGHVEEMGEENRPVLDTIKAVFGISFHDKIGV